MKSLVRFSPLGILVCLAVSSSGCFCIGPGVSIPDEALDSAIRAELGKPFGCLSIADLLEVTELQASSLRIRSLEGLQFCTNLLIANLHDNEISSLDAIAGLGNLTYLDVSSNNVTNIEAVTGLFFLRTLVLDDNVIRDFSPLVDNVTTGGFPEGGIVVIGEETIQDAEGNFTASFLTAVDALTKAGVEVQITGPSSATAK